ncbi:MAG: hypothetical protein, partial [Olavius algarvensis Gamma 1 endosymbiont]
VSAEIILTMALPEWRGGVRTVVVVIFEVIE